MEEKEEKFSIDTENLKNETAETAKKVKESMKGTNIKDETLATKGFIAEMIKNPLEKLKEVAEDNSAKFFKTALFLVIIWVVAVFITSTQQMIYYYGFSRVFSNILSVLKKILAPAIGILVYSLIILLLNTKNKKSLTTIISTVTIAQIPLIVADVISLLTIISKNIVTITGPFTSLCSAVSIVLSFFGFKYLFGKEESKDFIKKYVLIQAIYAVCYIVIRLLGIYIYM